MKKRMLFVAAVLAVALVIAAISALVPATVPTARADYWSDSVVNGKLVVVEFRTLMSGKVFTSRLPGSTGPSAQFDGVADLVRSICRDPDEVLLRAERNGGLARLGHGSFVCEPK